MSEQERDRADTGERVGECDRRTEETGVRATLNLDVRGTSRVETGLPFLDHMIGAAVFHAGMTVDLRARGDLAVDDHHTVEDCGLVLGRAFRNALADWEGIRRFGHALAPLDEALARAVVDLSGRPFAYVDLGLRREMLGTVACENLPHFFRSLSTEARLTLHLDVLRGENDHHRAEAAFKAFGLALAEAAWRGGRDTRAEPGVPSTKGALDRGSA